MGMSRPILINIDNINQKQVQVKSSQVKSPAQNLSGPPVSKYGSGAVAAQQDLSLFHSYTVRNLFRVSRDDSRAYLIERPKIERGGHGTVRQRDWCSQHEQACVHRCERTCYGTTG